MGTDQDSCHLSLHFLLSPSWVEAEVEVRGKERP